MTTRPAILAAALAVAVGAALPTLALGDRADLEARLVAHALPALREPPAVADPMRDAVAWAAAVAEHCEASGADPFRALQWLIIESTLRCDRVGRAGEVGCAQVMPRTARDLDRSRERLQTIDGSAEAMCVLLAEARARCGDDGRAMRRWYRSGQCR